MDAVAVISISSPAVDPDEVISIPPFGALIYMAFDTSSFATRFMDVSAVSVISSPWETPNDTIWIPRAPSSKRFLLFFSCLIEKQ